MVMNVAVMTEEVLSQIQAEVMGFLGKVYTS